MTEHVENDVGSRQLTVSEIAAMRKRPMEQAVAIMRLLRSPEGCPWDREQSFDSIKRHTLEETYEVFDAIERRDWPALRDELGDLLLQVLLYAQIAADDHLFDINDVAAALSAKLIRRHPHIFSTAKVNGSPEVVRNWEAIKREERKAVPGAAAVSFLDTIPRTMPGLLEASKLGSQASKLGFDWPDVEGLFEKLGEETEELRAEVSRADTAQARIEEEFGDLLFTAVNLGRHLGLDAESALRAANRKFRRRFTAMEQAAGGTEALERSSPEHMEELWRSIKLQEEPSGTKQG